jgi:7-cyano-7-deazaguanine synthase
MKTLVICSGGLDSVTLAYLVAAQHELSAIVSFDYGQRHQKEVEYARLCAESLGAPYHLIDITSIGEVLTGSSLTDDIDVPDGHYAEHSMKSTVVPNRNTIMLSIAFGMAVSTCADTVAAAVHSGDHFIYPDCRPEFIDSFAAMQKLALQDLAEIELFTPFIHRSKADIVRSGANLQVPFADTWSCYKGREVHCGRCGTCVERREAFHLAGVTDPTEYKDPDFWQSVT